MKTLHPTMYCYEGALESCSWFFTNNNIEYSTQQMLILVLNIMYKPNEIGTYFEYRVKITHEISNGFDNRIEIGATT